MEWALGDHLHAHLSDENVVVVFVVIEGVGMWGFLLALCGEWRQGGGLTWCVFPLLGLLPSSLPILLPSLSFLSSPFTSCGFLT